TLVAVLLQSGRTTSQERELAVAVREVRAEEREKYVASAIAEANRRIAAQWDELKAETASFNKQKDDIVATFNQQVNQQLHEVRNLPRSIVDRHWRPSYSLWEA